MKEGSRLSGWLTVYGSTWRLPFGSKLGHLAVLWAAEYRGNPDDRSGYWYADHWDDLDTQLTKGELW